MFPYSALQGLTGYGFGPRLQTILDNYILFTLIFTMITQFSHWLP